MTLHKLRKALMQGRFFYVGRLSHFALWRINGSAPRQLSENLNLEFRQLAQQLPIAVKMLKSSGIDVLTLFFVKGVNF